jgi:meiosis-specific APC/C activator protein AMA1
VSFGTVWTVGGLAPLSSGVQSGHGGLLASGTNAPLYTTSFLAARSNAIEEMEKHEGRLAEALELDRASRVLEFRDPSGSPLRAVYPPGSKCSKQKPKTVWKGTEWVMGGLETSKPWPRLRTLY